MCYFIIIHPSLIQLFPLILLVAFLKFPPTNETLKRLFKKRVTHLQTAAQICTPVKVPAGSLLRSDYSSPFCPLSLQPKACPPCDQGTASARYSDHQLQQFGFECLLNPPVCLKWPTVNRPLAYSDHTRASCIFSGCLMVITAVNRNRGLRKVNEPCATGL